jgi:hypothetical protein
MEKVIMQTSYTDTGYCCMCELIPGWTTSGSKDFGKFKSYVQESIDIWLEWKREDGEAYPSVFDGEYQVVYQFDVRAFLNYYQGTLSFAGLQKITGINQKQLANYAAGRSHPRREQAKKIQDGLHRLGEELSTVTLWF